MIQQQKHFSQFIVVSVVFQTVANTNLSSNNSLLATVSTISDDNPADTVDIFEVHSPPWVKLKLSVSA